MSSVGACSVPDCTRAFYARTFCHLHYQRWRTHGDPLVVAVGGHPVTDPDVRFRSHYIEQPNGCHIWTAAKDAGGYGFFHEGGKLWKAHRWAWERRNGPVPARMVLDHYVCNTPSCVNPEHTRPATHRENLLRGRTVNAANLAKTTCMRGHAFDHDEVGLRRRQCLICKADRAAARHAAAPAG